MEIFNIVCGVCSILGLVFSIVSLFMVTSLKVRINNNKPQGQIGSVKRSSFTQNFYNIQDLKSIYEYVKKKTEFQKGISLKEPNNDEFMTFVADDENGEPVKCQVLFTFESEETKKNYMVYTDYSKDKYGNTQIYASMYNPNEDQITLLPIETDKEWRVVETMLAALQEYDNLQESENLEDTHKLFDEID